MIILENHSSWLASNDSVYRNIYKFDYHYKYSPSVYWVFKEQTSFNYDKLNKAYLMPILPFQCNDICVLSVNFISSLGLIDFDSFQWKKLKHHPMKSEVNYELNLNNKSKEAQVDYSRICEIEIAKMKWAESQEGMLSQIKEEIERYISILNANFSVISIQWDDIGYTVIKIKTKAIKPGVIVNSLIGINITIIPSEESLVNEIKKNGLLYDSSNNLQVRVGDCVLFYLSMSVAS